MLVVTRSTTWHSSNPAPCNRARPMNATASVWTHGLRLQIALIAVLSVAAIGWPAWDAYSDLRVIEHGQPIDDHMQEVGASIVRLDELMSVAAHMASARGDPKWEVAYRAAEPKLDRAIDEGQRLQVGAPPGTAAARLDTANNSLVAMEHQAFEAVRQGRRVDAERLLSNDSHEFQREQFAKGMAEYNANLSRAQDQVQASFVHSKRTDAAKTIASIALLVIGIFLMLRSTRRWQAAVVASNRLLNANALELQEFNEQLDVKVRERTKDLTDSAIASLN
ncbi:MAG: hypothetical protein ABIT64_01360, partial [Lysobacteraceae bacterium]